MERVVVTEAVGSLGDEAAKLLGAAEEWWREHAPSFSLHEGPECVICPVCQGLSLLRGASPEAFEHLTDAVAALLLALRAAIDAQERAFAKHRTEVPVEHIDIS